MEIPDSIRMPRMRFRRQAENVIESFKDEVVDDAGIISDKTGLPTWSGDYQQYFWRVILLVDHLEFWNATSISIPDGSLLQYV